MKLEYEYYSIKDFINLKIMKETHRTVIYKIKRGEIPGSKIIKGKWQIPRSYIESLLKELNIKYT